MTSRRGVGRRRIFSEQQCEEPGEEERERNPVSEGRDARVASAPSVLFGGLRARRVNLTPWGAGPFCVVRRCPRRRRPSL